MNELIKLDHNKTMSSIEIAELTSKRHDHVLRDCDNLNEVYAKMTEPTIGVSGYKDSSGRKLRMYQLTKTQTFDLMTGYNAELRIKINRRWAELESKQNFAIPQTFSQALTLAAKQAEQLELQGEQIKQLEPKGEFYDAVTGSEDTIDIGKVAKVLNTGIGRNKLFEFLREKKILQGNNEPYQSMIDRGYFRVIESKYNKPDGSACISLKTVVYQKGVDYIKKQLDNN